MKNDYGMITIDNVQEVAERIETMLTGKKYTFVACNEFFRFEPEVRTGQSLSKGKNGRSASWWTNEAGDHAGFSICDTYGVWGCSTNLKEQKYDPGFNDPYIVFEHTQIKITHRAPAGHLLYWTIAIENE